MRAKHRISRRDLQQLNDYYPSANAALRAKVMPKSNAQKLLAVALKAYATGNSKNGSFGIVARVPGQKKHVKAVQVGKGHEDADYAAVSDSTSATHSVVEQRSTRHAEDDVFTRSL